eukprot:1277286-Pyramimonas_sp.AAC.2
MVRDEWAVYCWTHCDKQEMTPATTTPTRKRAWALLLVTSLINVSSQNDVGFYYATRHNTTLLCARVQAGCKFATFSTSIWYGAVVTFMRTFVHFVKCITAKRDLDDLPRRSAAMSDFNYVINNNKCPHIYIPPIPRPAIPPGAEHGPFFLLLSASPRAPAVGSLDSFTFCLPRPAVVSGKLACRYTRGSRCAHAGHTRGSR